MRTKLSMQAFAAVVAVVSSLAWSAPAQAGPTCSVDTDCPGSACGTEVCEWVNGSPKGCAAAGTDPQGSDGWCDTAIDCKCAGATCGLSNHCSFTLPPDSGAAETDAAATAADAAVTATDAAVTATDAAAAAEASTTTPESDASTTTTPESDATVATGDGGTSEPSSGGGGKSSGCSIAAPGTPGSAPIAALVGIALAGAVLARKRRT